jgi:hypothetical protein
MNFSLSDFTDRFNQFLYRQSIRKLTPAERQLARDWSMAFIRREHPNLSDEQAERFYENLIHVRVTAVDEWTERMT